MLLVVFLSSIARACSMPSVPYFQLRSSPQLPPRSPAFLTAPRLQQSFLWAPGAPLPWCRRSPWIANAAPPRARPVALVSHGITSGLRNVPWALHASGGIQFCSLHVSSRCPYTELALSAFVLCDAKRVRSPEMTCPPMQAGGRALGQKRMIPSGTSGWRSCAATKRPTGARPRSRRETRIGGSSGSGARSRHEYAPPHQS